MRLDHFLKSRGLTLEQFAEEAGLPLATVHRAVHRSNWPTSKTVQAIEKATGGAVTANDFLPERLAEEDAWRADVYGLLARLLADLPDTATLAAVGRLVGAESPFGVAIDELAAAAREVRAETLRDEYFALFVGLGAGEVTPNGSYYLTGFLNEKPLALLRADMARLGIARAEGNPIPEDHIAALCDMMAGLIRGQFLGGAALETQRAFFRRHLGGWSAKLFEDIESAESARFYARVGRLGRLFVEIETEYLSFDA